MRNRLIPPPPKPVVIDPMEAYIASRKQKLLSTYESDINMSVNIDADVYDRKRYNDILKNASNDLERLWKTRILYEPTPRGPVIMYYDIYKQGFAYYSDQSGIPYSILNAVAMKYVVTFFCRDLFFDEATITTDKLSPLVKVFNEEEKKEKPKSNQPFAKLRNYKMEPKVATNNTIQLKNKFISLGKLYNFTIVIKTPAVKSKPTAFDGMFSYKDFKSVREPSQGTKSGNQGSPTPSFRYDVMLNQGLVQETSAP